jgi:hypothetical protein
VSTIASQPSATRALRDAEARRDVGAARAAQQAGSPSGAGLRGAAAGAAEQAAVLHWGPDALRLARGAEPPESGPRAPAEADAAPSQGRANEASETSGASGNEDTAEQRDALQELRRRDREVRTHEQAHKSAGGAHAGSIHLEYTVGPDGKRYASSGSVSIDVSAVKGDPEATLRKMQIVQRAATAPADPSGADRQVAARAASTATQARAELAAKRYSETQQRSPAARTATGGAGEPQPGGRGEPRIEG